MTTHFSTLVLNCIPAKNWPTPPALCLQLGTRSPPPPPPRLMQNFYTVDQKFYKWRIFSFKIAIIEIYTTFRKLLFIYIDNCLKYWSLLQLQIFDSTIIICENNLGGSTIFLVLAGCENEETYITPRVITRGVLLLPHV